MLLSVFYNKIVGCGQTIWYQGELVHHHLFQTKGQFSLVTLDEQLQCNMAHLSEFCDFVVG